MCVRERERERERERDHAYILYTLPNVYAINPYHAHTDSDTLREHHAHKHAWIKQYIPHTHTHTHTYTHTHTHIQACICAYGQTHTQAHRSKVLLLLEQSLKLFSLLLLVNELLLHGLEVCLPLWQGCQRSVSNIH
jgi:hypothetical protein